MSQGTHRYIMLTEDDFKDVSTLLMYELQEYRQEVSEMIQVFENDHPLPLNLEDQFSLDRLNEWILLFTEEDARRCGEEPQSTKIEDMTNEELADAYTEVCDERTYFSRNLRGKVWTQYEEQQYESMNLFAQEIADEQDRR